VCWPLKNIVNQGKGEGGRAALEGLAFFHVQKMLLFLIVVVVVVVKISQK